MQLCITVKLHTTPQQYTALVQTLRVYNAACNRLSQIAFSTGTFRKYDLQNLCYHSLKAQTGLNANHVISALGKVADAYKPGKRTLRTFHPLGAIEMHRDTLAWRVEVQTVSLNTVQGRLHLPFVCSASQKELLRGKRGQSDLILRDSVFYLSCPVTVTEAEAFAPEGVIGIDLGLVNVATDSEGNRYSGEPIQKVRRKYRRLRQVLQPKKTRSARKHLQKTRRRESRFVKNENHRISKELVQRAVDRKKALACETLTGIRQRGNGLNRAFRTELNNWTFLQLKVFLHYKARRAGVMLIEVDPSHSSQECSMCHHTCRENRKKQDKFCCIQCGYQANADYNAALNLAARATLSNGLMFRSTASA